jgi:hypothetical protein
LRDQAIAGESMGALARPARPLDAFAAIRPTSSSGPTRAKTVEESLLRVSSGVQSAEEQRVLYKARRSFERYRELCAPSRSTGERRLRAPARLPDAAHATRRRTGGAGDQSDGTASSASAPVREQTDAAEALEAHTWRIVMLALP